MHVSTLAFTFTIVECLKLIILHFIFCMWGQQHKIITQMQSRNLLHAVMGEITGHVAYEYRFIAVVIPINVPSCT